MGYISDYAENLMSNSEGILLIDNGKKIFEGMNFNQMAPISKYKTEYVNLELKFMKIVGTLDIVNENIIQSNILWEYAKKSDYMDIEFLKYNSYIFNKLNKLNEYIIYDMKRVIDEILSTISVIKNCVDKDKIIVSSIGDYIKKKEFNDYDDYLEFFETMDDLANSYKHSYANTDINALGRDENCFVALYSKYNNFANDPKPYIVSISYIISSFNEFYKYTFDLLNKLLITKND